MNRYVIVDIGNSFIKFGVSESLIDEPWLLSASRPDPAALDSAAFADVPDFQSAAATWCLASVSRTRTAQLHQVIAQQWPGHRVLEIDHRLARHPRLRFEIQPSPLEAIGIDRLAAVLAAIDRYHAAARQPPDQSGPADQPGPTRPNLIVIDQGTAVTIDAVDRDGRFLGGVIRAGTQLQLRSLHQFTDALPDLAGATPHPADEFSPFGRSTSQAIWAGTELGEWGAISTIVQLMRNELPGPTHVLLTGGAIHRDSQPRDWIIHPDLVLHGIRVMAQNLAEELGADLGHGVDLGHTDLAIDLDTGRPTTTPSAD